MKTETEVLERLAWFEEKLALQREAGESGVNESLHLAHMEELQWVLELGGEG